jgi:hypothetical protein
VAITDGKLDFGPWEQIFYGEFDGRRRNVCSSKSSENDQAGPDRVSSPAWFYSVITPSPLNSTTNTSTGVTNFTSVRNSPTNR